MTNLLIQPTDVWLFRDGRPFAAGEQSRAASIFPPTPRTMQGALRSARLGQSGERFDARHWSPELKNEVGEPNNFGQLKMRGPLLVQQDETGQWHRFYPLPADVTKLQSDWQILRPQSPAQFQTNWQAGLLPLLPTTSSEPIKFALDWMRDDDLARYLAGTFDPLQLASSATLFQRESRLGIGIDGTSKATVEGLLYQVEFIRLPANTGLLVEYSGLNLATQGYLQLGGEARAAHYSPATVGIDLATQSQLQTVAGITQFKLYLATPAIFAQGWLPKGIDRDTLHGDWRDIPVTLRAAALYKMQTIGGRNLAAANAPRQMRRAVPAGSVYHFETTASSAEIIAAFHNKCVSDVDHEIGFGLCYVGGW